jgi:hypothetical protein
MAGVDSQDTGRDGLQRAKRRARWRQPTLAQAGRERQAAGRVVLALSGSALLSGATGVLALLGLRQSFIRPRLRPAAR